MQEEGYVQTMDRTRNRECCYQPNERKCQCSSCIRLFKFPSTLLQYRVEEYRLQETVYIDVEDLGDRSTGLVKRGVGCTAYQLCKAVFISAEDLNLKHPYRNKWNARRVQFNAFLKWNRDISFRGEERMNGEFLEQLSGPIKDIRKYLGNLEEFINWVKLDLISTSY
jgi:hypothetical protein